MSDKEEKFIFNPEDRMPGTLSDIGYVCINAKMDGKWIFCLHHSRGTWECPGGHVEAGETAIEAAARELWEETGAVEFTLTPCWEYEITNDNGTSNGAVFFADVTKLGELPKHEMDKLLFTPEVPENTTYRRPNVIKNLRRQELYLEQIGGEHIQFIR